MKLSAPIYHLKRKAKQLSRQSSIPLHEALNRIALEEGYSGWSLLVAQASAVTPAIKLFPLMTTGDLVLVGARPGHGKTLMSLELAVEAMKRGNPAMFFTLEYTGQDILDRLRALGVDRAQFDGLFRYDCSDAINANYIMEALASAPRGTVVVIDYLQLLDQRRENPSLAVQVGALRSFARKRGLIVVFVSQIDRSYDPLKKPCPGADDIRLPNPLDLKLFDKMCFLNDGVVQFYSSSYFYGITKRPRGSRLIPLRSIHTSP
ncbi:DNA helicase [Phyllobacterium leguminum]|uniref:AAA domain-containing protein n=1 Tax=Phyllobacterium leguminum TaxID=314237 RepID=A0A318SV35_9HYPH|nr:DNA helicase [Phyllobacterium leguminum]PYE85265.1 AAA domain-containing protein [Phyllobacterium leguminum]